MFSMSSKLSCVSQVSEVSAEGEMRCELETRFKQIQTRLKSVSQETEEVEYIAQPIETHNRPFWVY